MKKLNSVIEEVKYPCINCGIMTNFDICGGCGNNLCQNCLDDICKYCEEVDQRNPDDENNNCIE